MSQCRGPAYAVVRRPEAESFRLLTDAPWVRQLRSLRFDRLFRFCEREHRPTRSKDLRREESDRIEGVLLRSFQDVARVPAPKLGFECARCTVHRHRPPRHSRCQGKHRRGHAPPTAIGALFRPLLMFDSNLSASCIPLIVIDLPRTRNGSKNSTRFSV